jgi:hypothetical protein
MLIITLCLMAIIFECIRTVVEATTRDYHVVGFSIFAGALVGLLP